jgi:hypothetical protein
MMKTKMRTVLWCLLGVCLLVIIGCGKKADENKPISEVKAEAEKMSAADLRTTAMSYKEAIEAKGKEVEKLAAKLKEIPVAEILGKEAKALKTEMDNINKSVSALKERLQIYLDKLKEKGGDLSGLQI